MKYKMIKNSGLGKILSKNAERSTGEKTTTANFTLDLHRNSSLSASVENHHIYRWADDQMNHFEQTKANFTPQLLSLRTAMYSLINKPH